MRTTLLLLLTSSLPSAPPPAPRDVLTVIGGQFAPDHLGLEAYDALRARVLAHPAAWADALQPPPEPTALANLRPETLLDLTEAAAPAATRAATARWQGAAAAAHTAAAHPDLRARLARRAAELNPFTDGARADITRATPGLTEAPSWIVDLTVHATRRCDVTAWEIWADARTTLPARPRSFQAESSAQARIEVAGHVRPDAVHVRCR